MPHCDTLDGPVVTAARKALASGNINYVLIWVPQKAEGQLTWAFAKTCVIRKISKEVQELADFWFFETTVRLHRAGEGEPYTGLKPAGLSEGPIVPKAEAAIKKGNAEGLLEFMEDAVRDELKERFKKVLKKKNYDIENVKGGREYIQAYINFVVFVHHLYESVKDGGEHKGHE